MPTVEHTAIAVAGNSALASVCPSHLSCLPWDGATWVTVRKSPRAAQVWAFRGIQEVTCQVRWPGLEGEEGERAALRVSYRAGVLGGLPGDSWLLGISWLHWGLGVSARARLGL